MNFKTYYLVQFAYHFHSLIFQLFLAHRNDFVEMVLHHTCAIFLVGFSYSMNFLRVGSLVLFVHDTCDIISFLVKAVVDTNYTIAVVISYFLLLLSWGYMRLFVLPVYLIYTCWFDFPEIIPEAYNLGYYFFNTMLFLLFLFTCVLVLTVSNYGIQIL